MLQSIARFLLKLGGWTLVGEVPTAPKVMIVDDVITAGTAVREAYQIITQAGAEIAGLTISLDREERGQGSVSAVQELKGSLGIPVVSIAGLGDLVEILEESGEYENWLEPVVRYRRQYGVVT